MVTGTTERIKGKNLRFTCMDVGGRFTTLKATSPKWADRKTNYDSDLIIQGTAGDIGARRVKCAPGRDISGVELKEGAVCTIILGDPIMITNAKYCGETLLGRYTFLAFTKNRFHFWVHIGATIRVSSIGRKKV